MLDFSEDQKIEYLEKLESQSVLLSENMLLNLCDDSDDYIRSELAKVLSDYHNELSEKILVHLIDDDDEIVRANACDSIGWSNSKSILEKLISILQNDMYLVRGYALLSASDIIISNNYTEYIQKIKKIMKCEKSKFVLLYYWSFLYRLGEKKYLIDIVKRLNAKKYSDRCNAANLLYYIVDGEDFELAIGALKTRLMIEKTHAVKSTLRRVLMELEKNI